MKCIAVYNNKGGTAKTTSCLSIASTLCSMGKRCLIVELDSQGCLGDVLLTNPIYDGWRTWTFDRVLRSGYKFENLVTVTGFRFYDKKTRTFPEMQLDLIPASSSLAEMQFEDMNELKKFLRPANDLYDFCFLDMPPSNDNMTYLGLLAADYLLTPFRADLFSASAIKNVESIYRKARTVNRKLKFIGAFIVDFDTRYKISQWTKDNFKNNNLFFKSFVRHSSCFDEANLKGVPIVCLTGSKGAEDYLAVTEELLERVEE